MKLISAVSLALWIGSSQGFVVIPSSSGGVLSSSSSSTLLEAGKGMGMGMGTKSSTKKKNGKKKKTGMGKSKGGSSGGASFDVSSALNRLEKRYDELMLASAKQIAKEEKVLEKEVRWGDSITEEFTESTDTTTAATADGEDRVTSEFMIAARASTKAGIQDWVPVAQMCIARPIKDNENSAELAQIAVSSYCRELSHVAAIGAPVFKSVARNDVQYSVEAVDSFFKFVYESVVEGGNSKDSVNESMTKVQARETLGLETGESDKSAVKQAYRKMSFQLHPDRFEGSEAEEAEAAEKFAKVKLAYDTLSSGVRVEGSSWYESLGGRERTEFKGPVNLLPLAAAQEQLERDNVEGALIGLDRDLIQSFVARNLRSE